MEYSAEFSQYLSQHFPNICRSKICERNRGQKCGKQASFGNLRVLAEQTKRLHPQVPVSESSLFCHPIDSSLLESYSYLAFSSWQTSLSVPLVWSALSFCPIWGIGRLTITLILFLSDSGVQLTTLIFMSISSSWKWLLLHMVTWNWLQLLWVWVQMHGAFKTGTQDQYQCEWSINANRTSSDLSKLGLPYTTHIREAFLWEKR